MNNPEYKLYWGVMHCHIHSDYCHKNDPFSQTDLEEIGPRIDRLYDFVQHEMKYDFLFYADHHNMGNMIELGNTSRSPWHVVRKKQAERNRDGSFAAMLGYEYQDGQEYNVYLYNTDRLPVADTWKELISGVQPGEPGIILAAHNRPHPTDWHFPVHENFRAIEIVNDGGRPFERWANTGLLAGHRGAFIGGSDDHSEKPGRSSCTGIWARSLCASDIWDGLWNRRTVAATGFRPKLFMSLNRMPMGRTLAPCTERTITVCCTHNQPPVQAMVIKNGGLFCSQKNLDAAFEFSVTDTADSSDRPQDYYYAKLIFADGNIAYTSPVWMENNRSAAAAPPPSRKITPAPLPEKTRDMGSEIGWNRFYNAGGLVAANPRVRVQKKLRDMVTHCGPNPVLFTSVNTVISPTMDSIRKFEKNGSSTELRTLTQEDYQRTLVTFVEIKQSILEASYLSGQAEIKTLSGPEPDIAESIEPITPYLFQNKYITPMYLTTDGSFLYVINERELTALLPCGKLLGFCQEGFPAFPASVAARSLGEIYVLSSEGRLTAYDLSAADDGKRVWTADVPNACVSVCILGNEILVYNEISPDFSKKNRNLYRYTFSGDFICQTQIDLFNRKGTFISPGPENGFVAIHNPQTQQATIYRDEYNRDGVLRFFGNDFP